MPDFTKDPYASMGQLGTAAGYPQRSGGEIQQVWSKQVLVEYTEQSVAPAITTKEHTNELKAFGDNLIFNVAPKPTVRDRTLGSPIVYEMLKAGQVVVPVDQQLEWAFEVDEVDLNRMTSRWMPIWTEQGGTAMAEAIDLRILAWLGTQVDAHNTGVAAGLVSGNVDLGASGDPVEVTKTNALQMILRAAQVLDEYVTPKTDRFIVIPPAYRSCLMDSDIKAASLTGDAKSPVRNGELGMIDRFRLYESTHVPYVTDGGNTCYSIPFGWKKATGFDTIVEKVQHLTQMESSWTQAMRGLSCYARKVIWPRYVGMMYVRCTPS